MVADDAPPGADDWFAALAEHLTATLEQCGLVRCPGDIMATNPARRVPLGAWQEQFIRWMEEPEEDAVLAAATYADFRQLHGELAAEAPLRRVIGQAAGNRRFLGRLAVAALWRRPPLGFLHHLRGDHHGRIDLKAHGTALIVDLARLLALEAGSPEVATTARLQAAAEHGTAGTAAADLAAAFEYLQQLRLHHQAEQLAAGAVPDDAVLLAELTTLQRRWLKDTALLIHTCQESVRIAYGPTSSPEPAEGAVGLRSPTGVSCPSRNRLRPAQLACSWRRPTPMTTGVSSRYSPRGRISHDQPIRVPFGTGSKPSVPGMSAAGMWIDDASRFGRS